MSKTKQTTTKKRQSVDDIREATYQDMVEKLNEFHRCAVLRPTGFGKTFMLTRLLGSDQYTSILYLYPAQVIKDTVVNRYYEEYGVDTDDDLDAEEDTIETYNAMKEIEGVTLMTYTKLAMLKASEIRTMKYELIICDEMHRLGAPKTKLAISKLISANKNAHIVGATATPVRTDAFDAVNTFFNDITTFEYNMHNAMHDGLIQRPYYFYCPADHDIDKMVKEEAFMAGEDPDHITVTEVYKKHFIELANLLNMDTNIRNACDTYAANTSYLKFIVFFSTINHIHEKMPKVVEWFENAYPKHKVRTLVISSENAKSRDGINQLKTMKRRKNTIDLICCINMVNMGYHVNDITGILMYRCTKSDIIYGQQLGRAFSSGNPNPPIVFDVVDNLHRKGVFDLLPQKAKAVPTSKRRNTTVSCGWHVDSKGVIVDQDGDEAPLVLKDGNVYDNQGNLTNFVVAPNGEIKDDEKYRPSGMKCNVNTITEEDVIMEMTESTYRELIAKLVAESVHQRCKMALELHFRKWCLAHGLPYPITNEEMERLSKLTREDFMKEFEAQIQHLSPDYPLHDVKKLLSLADDVGIPPLRMFAKLKNVSIPQILDVMGVENVA